MPESQVKYRAVVSDLHLGEGGALENFVHGQQFQSFLQHVKGEGAKRGGVAELIMNGDVVDFLQIAPFENGHWRLAIGKLGRVFEAHRQTFKCVAEFVESGNRLVMLVGNHDVELMFRDVQEAFIDGLGLSAAARSRVVFPNDSSLDPQRFRGWTQGPFVYSLPGIHIEHGNQLDPLNYFDHRSFYQDEAQGLLRLPWGSRFVLSVFNKPASRHRYLDKVRSKAAAALILWVLDPDLAHEALPGFKALGPDWVRKLIQFHLSSSGPVGGGARSPEGQRDSDVQAFGEFGAVARELEIALQYSQLRSPAGARGEPAVRAKIALLKCAVGKCTTGDETSASDEHAVQAFTIAEKAGANTVVLGHTHGARDVTRDGWRYLNTGTWLERVNLDRLSAAMADASGDPWPLVAAMLEPATFQSAPKLSYVEICDSGVVLRDWSLRGCP